MKNKTFRFILAGLLMSAAIGAVPLNGQGHWEFGVHYSGWTLNLLKGFIEDVIGDTLETELKDRFLDDIRGDYPSLVERSYRQTVTFDSGGHNYGFEVRFYPAGEHGSFSLGLAVEKTRFRVGFPEVSGLLALEDTATGKSGTFEGLADGEMIIEPLSFHLGFRWDIFPTARFHPYVTFGVGVATAKAYEEATFSYGYKGTLTVPDEAPEVYEDSVTKTFKQIKEEEEAKGNDFFLPPVFPIFQLNLGLRGKLSPNFHVLVDAGIWNGFLLRGGISLRI
ncbi:MAG: hypothetical protein OEW05_06770 [Candidatus Aminicenantes bacterium]|nr:hypothetical protein [Candidatus Aminicenantes bacterium]